MVQGKNNSGAMSFEDLMNSIDSDISPQKESPTQPVGLVIEEAERDKLTRHMAKCWLIPTGKDSRVPIKVSTTPDGIVQNAEIMDEGRMESDADYCTVALSARRAVLDPRCSPLPIPKDKYEVFKEFIFVFDSKKMF